jgi:DNA polymerase (family 10)
MGRVRKPFCRNWKREAVAEVLALAGLPRSTAGVLARKVSVRSLDELAKAAEAHRLWQLPGLNLSLEHHILRCIKELRTVDHGILMDVAHFQAEGVKRWLLARTGVQRVEPVGELRRGKGVIREIEVLAAAEGGPELLGAFAAAPLVREAREGASDRIRVASTLGLPVTLHTVQPDRFGAALLSLTGSSAHLDQLRQIAERNGLEFDSLLSQDGLEEEQIYQLLGLPFIPPELREGQGELEAAREGKLPNLIMLPDLKGDVHMHTSWADGLQTIEEMAGAARARGYCYVAICDHSKLIEEANGLDEARLVDQGREIERLNAQSSGFTILRGVEVDIRADGELDLASESLIGLDLVTASIHIPYGHDEKTVTRRLIAAMENPLVDIVGHPTGRLLKGEDLYAADVDELLRAAARTGTALEINGGPDRLDLSADCARRAGDYGIPLVVSSDAHSTEQLGWIRYGLATARRAWLEKAEILNALPAEKLLERLKRRRRLDRGVEAEASRPSGANL